MRITINQSSWIDISILLLTLIVTLLGLGSYGLYEPHEGHFAMVGQEMLWRGDWITPHLNGSPYLNKPPLLYWSIATSTAIFGSSEFSARLPIALAGWLGLAIAGKWTRDLWGIYASRVAMLMMSVTLGWFIFSHQILIDVLLGTLLIASNYCLWRSLYQPRSNVYWWGTYVSLGLCVLTKGLVGVVFPAIGCLSLVVVRQDLKILRRIKLYRGILLILAVVLPWFIAVERANPGFWHYFIVNEHLDRLLDRRFPPDYEVSKIGALGYLSITICWCLPWILFWPSVIKSTWKEWRKGFLRDATLLDRRNSDGIFLLSMAAVLPVVLFLPLASRLIYYSVPAIPAYIILCAGWWSKHFGVSSQEISAKANGNSPVIVLSFSVRAVNFYGAIAISLGISCYAIVAMVPRIVDLLPNVLQTAEIENLFTLATIVLGTGLLASGIGLRRRFSLAWLPLFVALTITYVATIKGFYLYQNVRSAKNLVQQADRCLTVDTQWIFEGSREIGAGGAIAYYLNQGKHQLDSADYRTVMVLKDGGVNRLPPQFPGATPQYLISQEQLQTYWDSDRPTVFLTDFLRQPNDPQDPLNLNLPKGAIEPYLVSGQRRLYLNQAASDLAGQRCF